MYSVGLQNILNMGTQSMANQQVAINTVGNNISNINTAGYARQRANMTEDVAPGQQGELDMGSSVQTIESLRSPLLDSLVQQSLSGQGFADNNSSLASTVEDALGENFTSNSSSSTSGTAAPGSAPIQDALTSFFASLQALAASPSSASARQAVVSDAQTLSTSITAAYQRMTSTSSNVATDASSITTQINSLSSSIAQLNQQITEANAEGNSSANELTDTRTADVEQLSSLVNVTATTQSDGSVTVSLADAPGVTLVDHDDSNGTGTTQSLSTTYDPTAATPLVVTASSSGALAAGDPSGGSLGADLNIVNNVIGSSTGSSGILGTLNSVAGQIVSQVNTQNEAGFDLTGAAGGAIFTGTDASDIGVSSTVANDPSLIAAGNGTGVLDGSNAQAMANLQSSSSIIPAFQTMVANVGQTVSAAQNSQTVQDQITQQLQTQRDSVSGVSIDEEMTNLINFQQAYSASARLVTTISNMYSTLISVAP